ncbi:DUF4190 domain-containing protein [Microbacterium sp.]|uniref:DUF4190 domain-containing protein n=1 Tax=Microbacterium sp. TaxID=51671 RepID=UPI0037C62F94
MSDPTQDGSAPDAPTPPPPAHPDAPAYGTTPPDYPGAPAYGTIPPPYAAPPAQQYGAPQQQYGAPQQQYGAPQQPYGAAPQYAAAPGYGGYPAGPKYNVMAIVSFVSSLVGLFVIPIIGQIVGIITGHISLNQLKTSGENGRGLALAGTIIGWVSLGLAVLAIILIFAFVIPLAIANGARLRS